jgi:DUF971 family protein
MDAQHTPTDVKAPMGARVLEIQWADGGRTRFPHRLLRGYCPCAGCQGHSGPIRFKDGGNLELRELEPVGNYALSLKWGDSHDTGIYDFAYLRRLGDWIEAHGEALDEEMPELPRG